MEEIIDYIMHTPGNTNPNILREMMKNGGGSSGDLTIEDWQYDADDDILTAPFTAQEYTEGGDGVPDISTSVFRAVDESSDPPIAFFACTFARTTNGIATMNVIRIGNGRHEYSAVGNSNTFSGGR